MPYGLVGLIVVLIVVGAVLYLLQDAPIDAWFKKLIYVVVVVVTLVLLLEMLAGGGIGHIGWRCP